MLKSADRCNRRGGHFQKCSLSKRGQCKTVHVEMSFTDRENNTYFCTHPRLEKRHFLLFLWHRARRRLVPTVLHPFVTWEMRKELETICVPQLFLGWLLGTGLWAIGYFFPDPSTSPRSLCESLLQFPFRFLWRICNLQFNVIPCENTKAGGRVNCDQAFFQEKQRHPWQDTGTHHLECATFILGLRHAVLRTGLVLDAFYSTLYRENGSSVPFMSVL